VALIRPSRPEYVLPRAEIVPGVRRINARVTVGYLDPPTVANGTYHGRGPGEFYLRIDSVLFARSV
jgi:hypothetical protein